MGDIELLLSKVDRLQELIHKEPIVKRLHNVSNIKLKGIKCDDYIVGLYNGLELGIALLEDREPVLVDEI